MRIEFVVGLVIDWHRCDLSFKVKLFQLMIMSHFHGLDLQEPGQCRCLGFSAIIEDSKRLILNELQKQFSLIE